MKPDREGAVIMLLYLHIPFCDSRCHYCSFNTYEKRDSGEKSDYMDAISLQLERDLKLFDASRLSIKSLFIGGGTPSTVKPALYEKFFSKISHYLSEDAEITCEANPNSATEEWLRGMKNLGANRLSLGVQSFDGDKLALLNRNHSPKEAVKAVERAFSVGFENISIDLIYDVDGDDEESLRRDLDIASSLPLSHISAYELTIEESTPFAGISGIKKGDEHLGHFIRSEIEKMGLKAYEVSNYGRVSIHNRGYWELDDYMGIGAGAVGFLKNRRYYPHTDIGRYISDPLWHHIEEISENELLTERIFLGLRSDVGIDSSILPDSMRERADILMREGKVEYGEGRYKNRDYFIADELALYLLS